MSRDTAPARRTPSPAAPRAVADLSIGAAARACGVKVPTIRFYEEVGLLPRLPRTEGNRRLYGPAEVKRLAFIRHARELGFDLDAIRTLLALQDQPDRPCADADAIAAQRLKEVRARIAALQALEAELDHMLHACAHGRVAECRVVETLADHARCVFHAGTAAAGAHGTGEEELGSAEVVRSKKPQVAAKSTRARRRA